MYLNVSLTPSPAGGDGSCSTPKTPEILNSLISLTTAPLPYSYANYQSQVNNGELLSPTSSSASPSEEASATQFGSQTPSGSQMSPNASDPGGRRVLTRVSGVFKGVSLFAGTPSPPVSELPSPVNTVEATKTALIKEGLKHQIKSKLQAAGVGSHDVLADNKLVKEEVCDSLELTPQDEERRLRRRERNKVAATKCRNKKKEKTVILLTESETVEDQNIRLKSEIQRLTSEKIQLEKLLEDPNHIASCRHSCKSGRHPTPPMVVITSPDAPELLSPSNVKGPHTLGVSSNVIQGVSEQSSDNISDLPFCSSNVSTTCESIFTSCDSPASYLTLSSPSSLSPCSLPNVSPPHLSMPKNVPSQTSTHSWCSSLSIQPLTFGNESSLLQQPSPLDNVSCMSQLPVPISEPLTNHCTEASSNNFISPKSSSQQALRRHQPYTIGRPTSVHSRPSPYPGHANTLTVEHEVQACRDYCSPSLVKEDTILTKSALAYSNQLNNVMNHDEYSMCANTQSKNECLINKTRTPSLSRYTPYNRANRHHNMSQTNQCAEINHNLNQIVSSADVYMQQTVCNQNNSNQFSADVSQSQFYPPCTYGNI